MRTDVVSWPWLPSTLVCAGLLAACPGSLDKSKFGDAAVAEDAAVADAGACDPITTIFPTRCATIGCHDATAKQGGLDLASADVAARLVGVNATGGAGQLIDRSNPDRSVIYSKVTASPPFGARMPTAGPLSDAEIECIHAWAARLAAAPPDGGP